MVLAVMGFNSCRAIYSVLLVRGGFQGLPSANHVVAAARLLLGGYMYVHTQAQDNGGLLSGLKCFLFPSQIFQICVG
jgi:hypothetical protein